MSPRATPLLALALASTLGCTQILGGDGEYRLASGGAGGTPTTAPGGAGGTGGTSTSDTTSAGGTTTSDTTTTAGGGGAGGTTTTAGGGGTGGTTTSAASPCETADLQTSPDHCGACDHSCLGGECLAGQCQPRVLAQDLQWIVDIALDATHLYWLTAGDGRIERFPLAGGAREIVVEGQDGARAILVDAEHVYWTDPGAKKIFRATKEPGATAIPFVANVTSPRRIARTGQAIVGTHGAPTGAVTRWPVMPGVSVDLVTGLIAPSLILTDATSAFFVDVYPGMGDDRLLQVPLDGSNEPTPIVTDLHEPRAIARDASFVYWADGSGAVARASAGGGVEPIASGADDATGVAVDDQHVYWTQLDAGDGALFRADKDGARAVSIASGMVAPGFVVVGDEVVCWMDIGPMTGGLFQKGEIHLLAK